MKVVTSKRAELPTEALLTGGVVVLRTDTLYGIVARADDRAAVERVYRLKQRDDHKPPIVLIADETMLFDPPSTAQRQALSEVWPGKVSVILSSPSAPAWLTRGSGTVAYRLPADPSLRALLKKTGRLIAPSANLQSEKPAQDIQTAQRYFGDAVDVYVDEGAVDDETPSQLLQIFADGTTERLR